MHALDTQPTTLIHLLRHGTPEGGTRYRGHLDDPLSAEGWEQMRAALGEARPWQRLVSSPLCRCADFARALAARDGLPLTIDQGFKEISFGSWEGRRVAGVLRLEVPVAGLSRIRIRPDVNGRPVPSLVFHAGRP